MASDSDDQTKRENVSQDEDSGLSMVDVLEEEKQLEEDAKAVLGDSDDKNCTYPLGYIPRQALYACITCVPPSEPPAGVCLACSYDCHEGHELVELYTKRNFRCDCGNSKFKDVTCKLCPTKLPRNSENQYNQNFCGKYCTCHRPYPDPDDSIEDEMIQCVICEDWYHGRHLQAKVPDGNEFDEMICQECMKNNDYLWAYSVANEVTSLKKEETDKNIDIETAKQVEKSTEGTGSKTVVTAQGEAESQIYHVGRKAAIEEKTEVAATTTEMSTVSEKTDNTASTPESSTANEKTDVAATTTEVSSSGPICLLADLQMRMKGTPEGATFWHTGWRSKVCKCMKCKVRYDAASVTFLLDPTDTVHAYEERGKQKYGANSDYDQGMQALSSMNRVQQVEVIHGYNNLQNELKEYLKKFAENGKMVREEDIREFFSGMEARKRQRVGSAMQWNCK